jgi:hypothetical protein
VVTLVSMVTSPTMVTVEKHWVQIWNSVSHKYAFNFHTKMAWLPWLCQT